MSYIANMILVIFIERVPINARKSNLQLNKMDEGAFRNVSIRNDFNNYQICNKILRKRLIFACSLIFCTVFLK